MYLDKINSIYNFNDDVVRNTPLLGREDDTLADLVDDQFDIDVAKKTINKNRASFFKKIKFWRC